MKIIEDIIRREGGFVNHPNDKGGPTNFGITINTLSNYLDRKASIEDVKNLTKEQAEIIYADLYIEQPNFHLLPEPLKHLVIDSGVHSGTHRAAVWLQEILKVKADGKIGPITLRELENKDLKEVYYSYLGKRMSFLGELITRNPKQSVFAHGWFNRLVEFLNPVFEESSNKRECFFRKIIQTFSK